jgi:hypothetical protein
MTKHPNLTLYIAKVIRELTEAKVNLYFLYVDNIMLNDKDNTEPSHAIFSEYPFEIKVATKHPYTFWTQNFLHEYCHYLQVIDRDITVKRFNKAKRGYDANAIISSWLKGKDFKNEFIYKCVRLVQAVELNCEKRVVDIIHKHKLEIDVDAYIQRANCYILFYQIMFMERKWYKKCPYMYKDIVDLMPKQLIKLEDDNWNTHIHDIYSLVVARCL